MSSKNKARRGSKNQITKQTETHPDHGAVDHTHIWLQGNNIIGPPFVECLCGDTRPAPASVGSDRSGPPEHPPT